MRLLSTQIGGRHMNKFTRYIVLMIVIIALGQIMTPGIANDLEPLTRDQMLSIAQQIANYTWTCSEANRVAPCVSVSYECDFNAGDRVTGIAYDWGGMDDVDRFRDKLAQGQAAGSHSRHGVTDCTTGIDCSGYVSRCWGQTRKYGTWTIGEISAKPKYNWYSDMKPGDALVKPGSHIVLFVAYNANGTPIVYEAAGSHGKVILNDWSPWSRYRGYYAIQYRMVVED